MQCSSEVAQHIDCDTVEKASEFAQKINSRFMLVSGGEPTMHPEWDNIVNFLSRRHHYVCILSNGNWLFDEAKKELMLGLLHKRENISIQITSIEEFYKDHAKTCVAVEEFKQQMKKEGIKKRLHFENNIKLNMVALGRAQVNPKYAQMAKDNESGTTSCFVSSLVAIQCPDLKTALSTLQGRGKFCHPSIDWLGRIRWSESCQCPHFATVFDSFEEIERKALNWRPCGRCQDYQKLLEKTDPQYVMARMLFARKGIPLE